MEKPYDLRKIFYINMDKELKKKKNNLLHSIMKNPKLAKSLGEAFGSPIGSTKRDQAKSLFSIMKKVGMERRGSYNGQGGPFGYTQGVPSTPSSELTVSPFKDYSNMMIFPAAPKLKGSFSDMKLPTPTTGKAPVTGNVGSQAPSFSPLNLDKNTWGNRWNDVSNNLIKDSTVTPKTGFGDMSLHDLPTPTERRAVPGLAGAYEDVPKVGWSPYTNIDAQIQGKKEGRTPTGDTAPTDVGGALGPYYPDAVRDVTGAPDTTAPDTTGTAPVDTPKGKYATQVAEALKEGTGAGFFAKNVVDEQFGGSLDAYMNAFGEKLKAEFDLTDLETELSNLKAQKQNLIPTMTNYITGKDKYLRFIDQMIDKTEGTLLKRDMGNPAVAASYQKYLAYLYTLKGRQEQRYGNFLNSAISDYNADLERSQSNYDSVYKQYNEMMTNKTAWATTEYNALYNSMTDMYNDLKEAPMRSLNIEVLQQEKQLNDIQMTKDLIDLSNNTNPDYGKNKASVLKDITDEEGILSPERIGANGLAGVFAKSNYAEWDTQATIDAINVAMADSILKNPGDLKQIDEFKDMIATLSLMEGGDQIASMISPSLAASSEGLMSEYVLNNLGRIKSATKDLVKGGWFGTPGLEDKEKWMNKNNDLNKSVLEDLFAITESAIGSGEYNSDQSRFVSDLFSGNDDEDISERVAKNIIASW